LRQFENQTVFGPVFGAVFDFWLEPCFVSSVF